MMKIPVTAIRPFEPHGIPKLSYGISIERLLEREFLHFNLLGLKESYCLNLHDLEDYLNELLKDAGAQFVSFNFHPRRTTSTVVTIYYTVPGNLSVMRRHIGSLHMEGGFSLMKGGL